MAENVSKNVENTEEVPGESTSNPIPIPTPAALTIPKAPWSFETFLENVDPDHRSFYIKMGEPYQGVYFTIDPVLTKFKRIDCLNGIVRESSSGRRKVHLRKLGAILKKCPNVENLKFFGVRITANLLKLITARCPKLKNLELNPQDLGFFDEEELDFVDEMKCFIEKSTELCALVIREPSEELRDYIWNLEEFGYDKVDRNFMFTHARSEYQSGFLLHHNVNFGKLQIPARGGSDSESDS